MQFIKDDTLLIILANNTFVLKSIISEQETIFQGHTDKIIDVIVLENNKILSWSKDKSLRIWNDNATVFKLIYSIHSLEEIIINKNNFFINSDFYTSNFLDEL